MSRYKVKSINPHPHLLALPVIEAARRGDVVAINKVLKHYDDYIAFMSRRKLYDEYGNSQYVTDDETRRIIETKLILKLMQFDPSMVS